MKITEYHRKCPDCKKDIYYSSLHLLLCANSKNTKCRYCCNVIRGKPSAFKGKYHTNEVKKKISISKLGTKQSDITKKKMSEYRKKLYSNQSEVEKLTKKVSMAMKRHDIRIKHLKALSESRFLGKMVDNGQLELLNKWNKLGFHFEPNYQLHTDIDLFYIDGYDKEKNVVVEYDSKYHTRRNQKEKDLIRQNKIVNILMPKKFWRYNSETKTIKNILEIV